MKTFRLFLGAALAAVLTCVTSLPAAELGMPAPALSAAKWIKGSPVNLAAGKGKGVHVIEFWATWCGPCRASIPHLSEMQRRFKDKGVTFVSFSDETAEKVEPFVKGQGTNMDYTVAIDPERKTYDAYMTAFGVGGIPHAFVVDKAGAIVWHGHPMAGMDQVIEEVVAGKYDMEASKRLDRADENFKKYFGLVSAGQQGAEVEKIGRQIIDDVSKRPDVLNRFAMFILGDSRVKARDFKLALLVAKAAHDATGGADAALLDTYARALFENGKKTEAIQTQTQAIIACKDAALRAKLQETLKKFESGK